MCTSQHKDHESCVILKLSTFVTTEACVDISSYILGVKSMKFYLLPPECKRTFLSDELKWIGHVWITAVRYTLKNVSRYRT